MVKQINGRWAFMSTRTQRPLAYYNGAGTPPEAWIKKQELRMNQIKKLSEASYEGNIGVMELVKFHKQASQEQKNKLNQHIKNKQHKHAWDLVQHVTGTKLHKSVMEEKDILPKAGAGQEGTDELRKTYMRDTPGQGLKSFKAYTKNK